MKAAMGRDRVLAITLVAGVLVLAGVLAWEWQLGKTLKAELLKMRQMPVTEVPAQKIWPEFTLPDAAAGFPELVSRNLFAANRRSAAPASKAGESVMKKGQFVLVGVMITPQMRSALLRDVQTNKTEVVALVGVIRGITLGEVEPSRVVLRQGAESEELALNVQTAPKRPVNQPNLSTAAIAAAAEAAAAAKAAAARTPPPQAAVATPAASAPSVAVKPGEAASATKPPSNIQTPLLKK